MIGTLGPAAARSWEAVRGHVRLDPGHRRRHAGDRVARARTRDDVVAADRHGDQPDVALVLGDERQSPPAICVVVGIAHAPAVWGEGGRTADRGQQRGRRRPRAAEVGEREARVLRHVAGVARRGAEARLVADRVRVAERDVVGRRARGRPGRRGHHQGGERHRCHCPHHRGPRGHTSSHSRPPNRGRRVRIHVSPVSSYYRFALVSGRPWVDCLLTGNRFSWRWKSC